MSTHSVKAKARHPETTRFKREQFKVGHITFEIADHPTNGCTFALIAGEATENKYLKPLFTGHISKGMGSELRRVADRFDKLAEKAKGQGT